MNPPPLEPSSALPEPEIDEQALLRAARAVREQAHSPYSGVRVGAALLDSEGRVHVGCNVENASYGLTVCAERNAVGRAVAEGARSFTAVAIATNLPRLLTPCGACRQVLSEFAPELRVICEGAEGERRVWRLDELLPEAFAPRDLDR